MSWVVFFTGMIVGFVAACVTIALVELLAKNIKAEEVDTIFSANKGVEMNTKKTLDDLMYRYGSNAYAIEDRGNGAANEPERLLAYDEYAKEDYGDIILSETSHDVWISKWQNPNTRGEHDFRIIFGA
jgi:hypothetical protein